MVLDDLYFYGLFRTAVPRVSARHRVDAFSVIQIVGVPRLRPDRAIVWMRNSAWDNGRDLGLLEFDTSVVLAPHTMAPVLAKRAVVRSYPKPPGEGIVFVRSNQDGELGWCLTWAEGRRVLSFWQHDSQSWKRLNLDYARHQPLQLDYDGKTLWIARAPPEGGTELVAYDCESETFGEVLFRDDRYSLGSATLHFSPRSRRLAGITYPTGSIRNVWFLPNYAEWQKSLDQAFPGYSSELFSSDETESRLLFSISASESPGALVLLDPSKPEIEVLTHQQPALKDHALRPTQLVTLPTRDGTRLDAFLTMPKPEPAGSPSPLVVLLSTGFARHLLQFHPLVQLLAAQGYAVLQVNHRGLSGYAPGFSRADDWQMPQMRADVLDAVNHVLTNPAFDPRRVAILGSRESALVALSAGVAQPRVFQAVAVTDGISDWPAYVEHLEQNRRATPGIRALLRDTSDRGTPEHFPFDQSFGPDLPAVFLAHDLDDPSIPVSLSRALALRLEKRGLRPVTHFTKHLHGETKTNRVPHDYLRALLRFLATEFQRPAPSRQAPAHASQPNT